MQEVPKIVRARLKAATASVARPDLDRLGLDHPDADQLTAFAERALPATERDSVLEHLARCGDCRDIVALALPAAEPVQTVTRPSPSGWLTWPALRWGFVIAGVVAIASIGVLKYQGRSRPTTMAYKTAEPQLATTQDTQRPLTAPVAPPPASQPPARSKDKITAPSGNAFAGSLDHANLDEKKTEDRTVARVAVAPVPPPPVGGTTGGSSLASRGAHPAFGNQLLPHGPRLANQWQQQNLAQNQASASAPPESFAKQQAPGGASVNSGASAAGQAVEVSGAAAVLAPQAQSAEANLLPYQPAPQPSADEPKFMRAKALPQPSPGQIGGYVLDPSGAVVANARITITPSTTGQTATAVTNSQGAWLIAGLPSGSYKARAEAPGFTPTILALNYDASQPSTYSFTLNVGSVAETVEVASAQGQLQPQTADAASSVTNLNVIQAPVNGRNFTKLVALSPGGPLWAIRSSGKLQRSLDQGKTWQNVDVNASLASAASETIEVTSRSSRKKLPAPTLTFRSVAAAGLEVWAGGSGAALYHSTDAGNHWTRVVPASAGRVLTGDVVSVEFADPQHGKLSTSTAEVWTTSDDGQTWQKQ
jgi:hypothetical protein